MSKEKYIPAGTYDDHDPALMGIVAYLIKNGHATVIEVEPEITPIAKVPEVTFTDGAWKTLEGYGLFPDSAVTMSDFKNLGIERVTKPDAEAYIESLKESD